MNLTITSLNENGYGVGQKNGQTLTVARTAPGDVVAIGAPASKARWTSAPLERVVQPGPDRVDPACRGFDHGCGGCQWLHLSYEAQLNWKHKNLSALLRTRAGFTGPVHPVVPLDRPEAYRNKLSLKALGPKFVFVPETDGQTLAPTECRVQTAPLQAAWAALRKAKVPQGVDQVHLRSNAGGQVGLHAFVAKRSPTVAQAVAALAASTPGCVGAGVSDRSGYQVVWGEESLTQTIGGTTWRVPHNGFFQTNGPMAGALLDQVRRAAKPAKTDRVLDLYCGAGFFGLALAPAVAEVVGIEENPQAVAAAQQGAQASGLANTRFLAGDLGPVLASLPATGVEIAVVDPPREGLLPQAIEALVSRRPRRIVYVSCHPVSLARDLKALLASGYRAGAATPVDMFPHTSHLEVVVTLEAPDDRRPAPAPDRSPRQPGHRPGAQKPRRP